MVGGRIICCPSEHARAFWWRIVFEEQISLCEFPKIKLNTRSSIETELVGADGFMPAICWTQYFLKAQGYIILDKVMFKDNNSSILLEKNGKYLSSKRTKHINIWYFFITDKVDQGDVSLVWCPTGDMIGDFMTKPLQGAMLCKFRDQILGLFPAQDPGPGKSQPGEAQNGKRIQ